MEPLEVAVEAAGGAAATAAQTRLEPLVTAVHGPDVEIAAVTLAGGAVECLVDAAGSGREGRTGLQPLQ